MARGGARNRSGPQADPRSGKSESKGLTFEALPAEGHRGYVPVFPLPDVTERELELWKRMWKTPQAVAWAREKWRHHSVAMYVRVSVRAEDPEAPASVLAQLHRFADQIGMTPAGLKENGWAIEAEKAPAARKTKSQGSAPTRRLRAV